MIWTDERVETLRKLWSEGLSASQIAAQLGGVSRNAVIGKVHRLKLSGRGRTTPAPARPKKPAQAAAPKPPQRPAAAPRPVTASVGATALQAQFEVEPARHLEPSPENIVVPISRQLQLIELSERTCKWPIGDPLADDFHFCGNESGESGPYCRYHARLAFQPASERRRVR
jgi:GcrA cell cycle regulator